MDDDEESGNDHQEESVDCEVAEDDDGESGNDQQEESVVTAKSAAAKHEEPVESLVTAMVMRSLWVILWKMVTIFRRSMM